MKSRFVGNSAFESGIGTAADAAEELRGDSLNRLPISYFLIVSARRALLPGESDFSDALDGRDLDLGGDSFLEFFHVADDSDEFPVVGIDI